MHAKYPFRTSVNVPVYQVNPTVLHAKYLLHTRVNVSQNFGCVNLPSQLRVSHFLLFVTVLRWTKCSPRKAPTIQHHHRLFIPYLPPFHTIDFIQSSNFTSSALPASFCDHHFPHQPVRRTESSFWKPRRERCLTSSFKISRPVATDFYRQRNLTVALQVFPKLLHFH